jgi:hypothetical protein
MNDKKLKRLEQLLDSFDSGAVTPEELIRAIDAVMDVVKQSQEAVFSKVDTTDEATKKQLADLEADIASAFERIASQTNTLSTVSATKDEIASLKREVSAELARVSALIPELPDEFDATDIYQSIEAHKGLLDSLSTLIVGENIRNSLEALPEGEKLAIDAIENLREELDKRQAQQNTTALIARRLDQIGDVDIAGVTNGQVLAYNATTKRWEASSAGAGTGVVETIVAGTGISVDNTDPANPIVSASGGAGTPGGSDTQIQFNDGGAFGGDADFTWDKTTKLLTIGGDENINFETVTNTNWDGEPTLVVGDNSVDESSLLVGKYTDATTFGGALITGIRDSASSVTVEITPSPEDGSFNGQIMIQAGNGNSYFQVNDAAGAGNGAITFKSDVVQIVDPNSSQAAVLDTSLLAGSSKTFTFPNQSGTIALLSDISGGTGITRTVVTTSGNFTAGADISKDYVYFIAGAHTGTLPTAVGNTNRYTFKNNHSANVTIDGDGTETIEGAANISIAPGESVDLVSNNTGWFVL